MDKLFVAKKLTIKEFTVIFFTTFTTVTMLVFWVFFLISILVNFTEELKKN